MKISVIHPSRGRPLKAKRAYNHWTGNGVVFEWIVSIDTDDPTANQYKELFKNDAVKVVQYPNRSITDAVNNGARWTSGDLLIVVSDDFLCPPGWSEGLIKHLQGKSDFVARVSDGKQNWIVTLPMMDRVYYDGKGYMYNPAYLHMFCDTEMTTVAELEGKIVDVPMVFTHEHPMYGACKEDETNRRANRTWDQGKKVYLSRLKTNFGIADVKGAISDPSHIDWIKKNA